jgi:hypothetical protein
MAQVQDPTNVDFVGKDDRSNAWTITSDRWSAAGAYIVLPINPESLEIQMRLLSADVAMKGTKFNTVNRWSRTKSAFDFPIINFKFNSGNIQPVFSQKFKQDVWRYGQTKVESGFSSKGMIKPGKDQVGNHVYGRFNSVKVQGSRPTLPTGLYGGNPNIPVGVQNLYALLALANDSWIMESTEVGLYGNAQKFSVANRIIVNTNSLAFPDLTLFGVFEDSGLQWTESAENFNNFDISFSLLVTNSVPSLTTPDLESMIKNYRNSMYRPTARFDSFSMPSRGSSTPTNNQDDRKSPADEKPEDLSLADRLRQQVAKGVESASAVVDSAARTASIKLDEKYAQRAEAEYQAQFLARISNTAISDVANDANRDKS